MSRVNRHGASVGDAYRDIADNLDNPRESLAQAMRRHHRSNPIPADRGATIESAVDANDVPMAQRRRGAPGR